MPCKMILDKAHEYNATVTAFYIGILLKAIFEDNFNSKKKRSYNNMASGLNI